jgi:hypothetical protein
MKKKKIFFGAVTHRGYTFLINFCASNQSEAAVRANTNKYYVKTYWYQEPVAEHFPEIRAVPSGPRTIKFFAREQFAVNNFDELEKVVNDKIEEWWKTQ